MDYVVNINKAIATSIDFANRTSVKASLDLWKCGIYAHGVKYLINMIAKKTQITRLYLGYNNIGDEGTKYLADALAKDTKLTSLYLSSNNIGAEGTKYLADALAKNNKLTNLNLYNNNIGDQGAKYLANMLIKNTTLTSLDLEYNNMPNLVVIDTLITRNKNYKVSRPSLSIFRAKSLLPTELYSLIDNCVLLQC